ncbi:MAG: hypothetical protein FWD75_00405 [Propionibacteriaceae bacterium]|nr:hypothetical protein [Propionibacteriaceae bacterium]
MTPEQPLGLPPLSAETKAHRRRQNRVIVAVAIMVLVPLIAIMGANRYSTSEMKAWSSNPRFDLNAPAQVPLDTPGEYAVWSFSTPATCAVSFGGAPVATTPGATQPLESSGLYQSVTFTATSAGDYTVLCLAPTSGGYAMVAPPSPVNRLVLIIVAGFFVGIAGFITGLVLLVVALVTNHKERASLPVRRQYR